MISVRERRSDAAEHGAAGQAVVRLTVADFRCYERARLDLDRRPVVLTGPNGAGKTNLLEAVSLLTPGRGLRRAPLAELDRIAPGGGAAARWAVAATVDGMAGPVEIGTGRDPRAAEEGTDRRIVRIDDAEARAQSALGEHVAAVWLVPQMDRLFLDGASERRRFLDRLAYGFDPAHAGRVTAYQNAVRERQRLLRDRPGEGVWLAAIEESIAARGVAVAAARREMVRRLDRAARSAVGPFPRPEARLSGTVEGWLDAGPALAAEDRFRDALAESRGRDAESGTTAIGPHRSDLEVFDAAREMPAARCSTGEQKALLVALVLASARLVAAERGTAPLLLLDEIVAHLDAARRAALFDEILALGAQAWLTGTDAELFEPLGAVAQHFRVEAATVRPSA